MVTAVLRSGSQPSGLNYLGKGNAHNQLVIQQQQQQLNNYYKLQLQQQLSNSNLTNYVLSCRSI